MDLYMKIIIGSILVNNIILAQFLGICPFLGVSNKVSTSAGMSAAVIFVMTLATTVTYILYNAVLVPLHIEFMQTVSYILVIAALVQMVEIVMKKVSPPLYQALGVFLPLITTNCAVLGVAIIVIQKQYNLIESVVYTISIAVGFFLALIIFAGIREQLDLYEPPKAMKGAALSLITAGLLSLAFMGFAGLV
ncbi:MAG: electron transport complex subunit RsxA [bacterium]